MQYYSLFVIQDFPDGVVESFLVDFMVRQHNARVHSDQFVCIDALVHEEWHGYDWQSASDDFDRAEPAAVSHEGTDIWMTCNIGRFLWAYGDEKMLKFVDQGKKWVRRRPNTNMFVE